MLARAETQTHEVHSPHWTMMGQKIQRRPQTLETIATYLMQDWGCHGDHECRMSHQTSELDLQEEHIHRFWWKMTQIIVFFLFGCLLDVGFYGDMNEQHVDTGWKLTKGKGHRLQSSERFLHFTTFVPEDEQQNLDCSCPAETISAFFLMLCVFFFHKLSFLHHPPSPSPITTPVNCVEFI